MTGRAAISASRVGGGAIRDQNGRAGVVLHDVVP